jgi:hypothetical protein
MQPKRPVNLSQKQIAAYTDSVFINCPFDKEYDILLKSIVFTIYRCGFVPRSAMEEDDGTDMRMDKITRLISKCKFGIHDISRIELDAANNLPRFNMPFELGLFWGAKKFGNKVNKEKVAMVFEKERYISQKYLSDLNGVDVKAHNDDVLSIIRHVRNWLFTSSGRTSIPSYQLVQKDYVEFTNNKLPIMLQQTHAALAELTFNDYCSYVNAALSVKLHQ